MIKRFFDIAFPIAAGMALVVLLAITFSPSFLDWIVGLLGKEEQRVIDCIFLSTAGIFGLWGLIVVGRWVMVQIEIIREEENFWRKVKVILRRNRRVLWRKVKLFWQKRIIPVFLFVVGAVGVALFILLFAVMFFDFFECWAKGLLGVKDKRDVIEFIGWGIAGILGFFGAIAVNRRAVAQAKIAKAQVKTADAEVKNNQLIERGHIQERFKTAVEHLSSEQVAARIASFHEFYYLACDNDDLRENIFDVLCAYLRQITTNEEYRKKVGFIEEGENSGVRPTEEVQSLLDVLFQYKDSQDRWVFTGFKPNLREVFLMGADLQWAHLKHANLSMANLQGVKLSHTFLRHGNLEGANLRGAILEYVSLDLADLCNADFRDTNMLEACMEYSDLKGADFRKASLWCAYMKRAELQGADFGDADLQHAHLQGVDLREVKNLATANLSEVTIKDTQFPEGYEPPANAIVEDDEEGS